jgi:hypothetical protein
MSGNAGQAMNVGPFGALDSGGQAGKSETG